LLSELGFGSFRAPRVRVKEEENKYVVNAEVPGIRKEQLNVSIGDGGRSLRIQGRSTTDSVPLETKETTPTTATSNGPPTSGDGSNSQSVIQKSNDESSSSQPRNWSSYSFSRTIWLPRPAKAANVSAKLDHGVLTLEIPKQEDVGSHTISID